MSKLAEILEHKHAEVKVAKEQVGEAELKAKLKSVVGDRRDFIGTLKAKTTNEGVAIIRRPPVLVCYLKTIPLWL